MTSIILFGVIAFLQALSSFLSLRKENFKDFSLHFGLSLFAVVVIFVSIFAKAYFLFLETVFLVIAISQVIIQIINERRK